MDVIYKLSSSVKPEIHQVLQKPKKELNEISGINQKYLLNNKYNVAWKLLGDFSELALNIIKCHKTDEQFPLQHIVQFYHFMENQFQFKIFTK